MLLKQPTVGKLLVLMELGEKYGKGQSRKAADREEIKNQSAKRKMT